MRPSHRADGEQHGDLDPNSDRESANDVGAGLRPKQRCYFILSIKSSGSSILQKHLSALSSARLPTTHHEEHETLFFTKAASMLGLPQLKLENSQVPYTPREAAEDIHQLSEVTIRLAERFGYGRDELLNSRDPRWNLRDEIRASAWSTLYKLPGSPRRLLLWLGWRAIHRLRGILHEKS